MREDELRKRGTCSACGKGIGHTGLPLFWTLKIERHGVDMQALNRQQGLTMMLGGEAALARVMGPDDEMTKTVMGPVDVTLCEKCAMEPVLIMALAEKVLPDEDEDEEE